MITTPTTIKGQVGPQNPNGKDAFKNLDLSAFLAMMIAELQNQDPMNPMDNAQLLQQVSQIREIESNMRLVNTLESLAKAQNITGGALLIGKQIKGLDAQGNSVSGKVDKVAMEGQDLFLYIGDSKIPIKNVTEVSQEGNTTDIH